MIITYKINFSYIEELKKSYPEKEMVKFSKYEIYELLISGDLLILNTKTNDYLFLAEISLFDFFSQLLHGLKNIDKKGEAEFSSIENDYEIKLKLKRGMVKIKDIDNVSVKYKKLIKTTDLLLREIVEGIIFLYPFMVENKSFKEVHKKITTGSKG